MKTYIVTMKITGRATCLVTASSEQEALDKANKFDIEDGSDELIEWEFDDAVSAEAGEAPNKTTHEWDKHADDCEAQSYRRGVPRPCTCGSKS